MHQEQHEDVNRRPRRVKQRKHTIAREELAQVGEVGKGLHGLGGRTVQTRLKTGAEDLAAERFVELHAGAYQQA